jgi:carbohydrate kinase (thermoresistant glucokinase family)
MDLPLAIVLIGVSGSGKSTVGRRLAPSLGATFLEGDAYHPSANVAKMRAGTPLDDADRWPWLAKLGHAIAEHSQSGRPVVVACSALRVAYREALAHAARRPLTFVHLTIDPAVLESRMRARRQHFMPTSLLESQLATLEPLRDEEDGTEIRETGTIQQTVDAIKRWIHLGAQGKLSQGHEKGRHRRPFVEEQKPRPLGARSREP